MSDKEAERNYEVAVAWHSVVYGLEVGYVYAESEEEARKKVEDDPWGTLSHPWPEDYDDYEGIEFDHIEWCG